MLVSVDDCSIRHPLISAFLILFITFTKIQYKHHHLQYEAYTY
ncbi:hypothetical protein HMPREF0290_0596 [Corynebacterium efficiens YS-314]|nr:hypothetical protein HMPREF0290_0596 [Corynebacterium efficiens YS-314]